MVVLLVVVVLEAVVVVLRDIDFAAEHRLDAGMLLRHVAEILHAVHIAVVRDCEARHAQFLRPAEELFDVAHSVQDGILGMDVQVYEGHSCTKIKKNHRPSAGRGCIVDNFLKRRSGPLKGNFGKVIAFLSAVTKTSMQ